MNHRERVLATLARRPTDRMPVDLWYTPEIGAALRRHCGIAAGDDFALWRALDLDKIAWVFMEYKTTEGGHAGAQVGGNAAGQRTMWGVPLKPIQAGQAHYDEFAGAPMAEIETPGQVADYPFWPDPDRFDCDAAAALARRSSGEFAVIGPWVSFFEIYCQLRGMEQAMMDVATEPELVDAILDRIEAIQTEMMKRFFARARGTVDLTFISDDIGGQTGLLISPAAWHRHLQPRMKRWCDLVHAHGIKVFFHSDGAFEPLIEPLIACGIDVLNPIQHVCPGMETPELKKKYGDRVIFHGGVDNQFALPRGTVEDVRKETRHCLDTLGAGRAGFICASCHNVQAGTPVENVLAMIDTVREY